MLSTAYLEYARALDKGIEIEEPVAWLVHCAWRRTQNLLTQRANRPRLISTAKAPELTADDELTPEEYVLLEDRARKVHEFVAKLTEDQRRLVALLYLEGMSLREARRYLKWSHGKTQRCHEAVLREIRRRLPVRSSHELEFDAGVAAWLSFAGGVGGPHLPAGFEALINKAEHEASSLWAKAHDLARRFTVGGGSDATSAVASSGAGRAMGVCAAGLTIACVAGGASGIIGPGIGVVASSGGQHPSQLVKHRSAPPSPLGGGGAQANVSAETQPPAGQTSSNGSPSTASSKSSTDARAERAAVKATAREAQEATPQAEVDRVEQQASGIARAGSESSERSGASTSAGNAGEVVTVSPNPESSQTSTANNQRVAEQTSGLARAGG